MKFLKKGLVCLLAFVMTMSMTPMSVFAAGNADAGDTGDTGSAAAAVYNVTNPEPSTDNGLYTSKSLSLNDDGTGTITLETYVEGTIQQTGTPTDVVLVLDVSQSMSQSMGSTTKLAALKSAVNTFIDTTAKKNESAKTDALKSRISIVSFSGSAKVDCDFTSNATTLKTAVTNLKQSQGTAADYAMTTAKSQIDKIDSTRKSNKVVIFFTDGEPNHGSGGFNTTVANSAISTAKTIKAAGTTIYSIGVVNGADPSADPTQSSTSNINKFLHGISSNYPDATAYTNLGKRATDSTGAALNCYKTATNASELEKIFEEIGEEAVPTVELDEKTIVQDVMSEYVVANISEDSNVKLYTSAYTGKDASGNKTFGDRTEAKTATATVNDGTVKVTGFDFEPVVDKTDKTYQGKKLTIEIPVKLTDAAKKLSGETINSNNATTSAVINGELTVRTFGSPTIDIPKAKITIKADSSEKTYDGTALTDNGYTYTENKLVDGDVLTAVVEGSQTNAGSSANTVTSYKVMRGETDVTSKYDISTENGTLTVNKKDVTFTGESASKTYNGETQTIDGITVSENGLVEGQTYTDLTYAASGKNAGEYDGKFTGDVKIMSGSTDVTANYNITKTPGKLTITENEDKVVVTIVGEHATKEYNGKQYQVTGYTAEISGSTLYTEADFGLKDETAANAARTNVGTTEMGLTADSFKNNNANFKNVEFKVTDGYIKVTPKAVTFTGESDTVKYDGETHELTGITADGLVKDQTYTDLTYKASGKNVGTHAGAFTGDVKIMDGDKDVTDNYTVTKTPGALTITADETEVVVTITEKSGTYDYDGTAKTVEGYTVKSISSKLYTEDDFSFTGDASHKTVSAANAGTYDMGLTAEDFTNNSKNITNVKFVIEDGQLKINKKAVTFTGESDSKVYNGEEQEITGITVSKDGLVKDHTYGGLTYSAKGTTVGDYDGAFAGTLVIKDKAGNDVTSNYEVTKTPGKLTITPYAGEVVVTIEGNKDTKVYNGSEQSVTGYEVKSISSELYTTKDFTFSGDATAERTNVGETIMGLGEDDFTNNNENFSNVKFDITDGSITITKKPVTFTGETASKAYNGETQTITGITVSENGLADGHTYTDLTYSASGKTVGEYNGEFKGNVKIMNGKEDVTDNYKITETPGKLTITENEDKVVVTIVGEHATKEYNGKQYQVTGYTAEISGSTLYTEADFGLKDETAANAARTNVGTTEMGLTADSFKNNNANFKNVEFKVTDGYIKVTPKAVTFTGESDTVKYDGETHELTGITADGLVKDQTYTDLTYKASGKNVGTHAGAFTGDVKIMDGDKDVTDNYTVTKTPGALTITADETEVVVTITEKSGTYDYDGTAKTVEGYTVKSISSKLYTEDDFSFTGDASHKTVSAANAGTYDMGLTAEDFTNNSKNITNVKFVIEDGQLKINKKAVTFTGESDSKVYNGEEQEITGITVSKDGLVKDHTYGGLTYSAKGTTVGDYDGAFAGTLVIKDKAGNDVTSNYEVTKTPGKLTITPYAGEVVVTIEGNKDTKVYNGSEQSVTGYEVKSISSELYTTKDFTFSGDATAERTNVGETIMGLGEDDFTNNNENFSNVKFDITDGSITITKKPVTFTGETASKAYNGETQTITGITVSENGLADGHTYTDLTYSASGKTVGEYNGEFKGNVKIMNGKEDVTDNYKITETPGKLTITQKTDKVTVTITENSGKETYDGTEKTVTGYKVTSISSDLYTKNDFEFKGDATAKGTDAGTYNMQLKPADFTNTNANFNNVEFVIVDGTLVIDPKAVTFTGETASKAYNGQEQTITGITDEGLVKGHTYSGLAYSAKGTTVGEYDGTFTGTVKIMNGEKDVTGNYAVTETPGKLTITQNTDKVVVTITENSGKETYDGTEKTVTGYKVTKISSDIYTANDFTFSGDATVKGTDAGTYDMKLKPEDFANKNGNFKNVEFKIVDGTLVIAQKEVTFTGESAEKVFNNKTQEITGITQSGLVEGHDYSGLTYSAQGKDVGGYDGAFTGDVKITDAQKNDVTKNYDVKTVPGKLTITQAEAEVTIVGNTYTTDYTGKEQSVSGFTTPDLPEGITVVLKDGKQASVAKTNAGTYSMGLTKDDFNVTSSNYKITKVTYTDGWLKINKIPVTITIADAEKVYGKDDPEFADAAMAGQIEGELKDVDLTVSRSDAGNDTLGTHEGVLNVKGTKESLEKEYTNYTFTVGTGNFTIKENTADLHVSAPDVTKTYDGEAVGTAATAGIAGATIKYKDADGNFTLDECPTITNAGSKTVEFQASLYGYTSATGTATLTVEPKEVVLTSESGTQIYSGEALEKPEVSGGEGFVEGEVTEIKATGSITNVGTVTNEITFTPSDKFIEGNYKITKNEGTLEVTPATLTVTADDKTKKQGEDNPELTGTITGFVNGEDESVLKGDVEYTTTAVKNSPVGEYPITAAGTLEAQNYTIEYVDGTLTITEAPAPAAKTGDDFNIMLYAAIAVLAMIAAAAVIYSRRRHNQ